MLAALYTARRMPSCVSILVVAAPIQLYEFEQLFGQLANFFFGTPILDAVIIIGETGDSGLYGDDFPKWIEDYAEANDHRYINICLLYTSPSPRD